mgnify:CR=1 FL=1
MAKDKAVVQYNQLPRPTFRWMKVNHLDLEPLAQQSVLSYTPLNAIPVMPPCPFIQPAGTRTG